MRRYKYKRLYTWTPNIAYLAGLVASDGYMSSSGRHINITSTDLEILESVRKILSLNVKIGTKKNGFGGMGTFIQFGDVALYDFFLAAGIRPAKSRTILKVEMPQEFYRDFLRGLFDGDGTVYGFQDHRWKNSFMYYTEFTGASLEFLEWLRDKNSELIGLRSGKIKPGIRAYKLYYAKGDSQKIFSFMYYDPKLPLLSRKYEKFKHLLASDPYLNVALGRVL